MSLKVANVRLELDDPEGALPEKISERLGVGREAIARWRILRKSLDARRHDDLHFVYSAEVELPEGEAEIARRGPWPDVERFEAGGVLDPESNYLFGEGGAGTFSDGKLTSRGTGPDVRRVLEILADCHGKPAILYEHRPHLGSNRLPLVVRTLRRKLEQLGGEVRFSCRVEDLIIADGRSGGLLTSSGHLAADAA